MTWDGLEIDMLSLGNADSILITKWTNGDAERVLVDGGRPEDAQTVKSFLDSQQVSRVDHLVCSHPDSDHVGGLVELVRGNSVCIGKGWVHQPDLHPGGKHLAELLRGQKLSETVGHLQKTFAQQDELVRTLRDKGVPVEEPFAGKRIGYVEVCGPSEQYYEQLLTDIKSIVEGDLNYYCVEKAGRKVWHDYGCDISVGRLLEGSTRPENDTSTVLLVADEAGKYLFTADAGVQAQKRATEYRDLSGCRWMQIPHHGSRYSCDPELVQYFRPKIAFVSAAGDCDHPSSEVIEAYEKAGATVYATYQAAPPGLHGYRGDVPPRDAPQSSTPL